MTDEAIVALYRRRDEAAIAATREKYGAYCLSIAGAILPDSRDAEECVSDALLRAWDSIPPQCPRTLRIYLARIVRNLAFDRFKREHAQKRGGGQVWLALDELEACAAGASDAESAVLAEELRRSVVRFLRELPDRERDIFLRRYFFVEEAEAIGRRYGMRKSAVLMRLTRTRKKLRTYLEKEGYLE